VLQHQGEDVDHLAVAAGPFEQVGLQVPERLGQFGEGRAVAQRAGLEIPGRSPVRACSAMVSTPSPLASQAALPVLHDGGNAVDAAIAAMAVLCVVETLNVTIGGDCFALVAPGGSTPVLAYNGSGRAPAGADAARARGWASLPSASPDAVTIPGLVEAWDRLTEAHGTRGLDRLLQPAIHCAEHGYPVHDVIARQWPTPPRACRPIRKPGGCSSGMTGRQCPGSYTASPIWPAPCARLRHKAPPPSAGVKLPRASLRICAPWAAAIARVISFTMPAISSSRSPSAIATTACTNARRTARALRRS
jgi:hypothetical protein